jgi:phospholipid transport system substrate-binding protein
MLRLALAAASTAPLLAVATARADATPDAVAGQIAALNDGLVAVMKAGHTQSFAQRYALLTPIIERVFDLPLLLRSTVGAQWTSLTADEQAALIDAFRRYTISTYVASFKSFGGERFEILPEEQRNVGDSVVVATRIVPATGKPARIDYVLHSTKGDDGDAWKVADILLDGSISQVAVQRSEFRSSLRGEAGAAKLIDTLNRKSDSLSSTP